MAPLYKRYIPPKVPSTVDTEQIKPVQKPLPLPTQDEAPKKRKRERTEEEIAERKAKKLRKKGIDPATVSDVKAQQKYESASAREEISNASKEPSKSIKSSESEFAHVKNSKKRHKLEKEARKARKAESAAQNGEEHTAEPLRTNRERNGHYEDAQVERDAVAGSIEATNGDPRAKSERRDISTRSIEHSGDALETTPSALANGRKDKEKPKNSTATVVREENAEKAPRSPDQNGDDISQPKKRRHKLESILKQPQQEPKATEDNDTEHLRKHEGVMHKFQKSKAISEATPKRPVLTEKTPDHEPMILDLGPLPQPDKAPTPEFMLDPHALPEWLANPTIIPNDSKKPFKDLGLEPKIVDHLSKLGFKESMPVQEALIPLLLPPGTSGARFMPGTESLLPDVAVGAATGSGKTIAYLLPLIESLRKTAGLGNLKALIVVPTRELVMQVAAVGESLARGSGLKIGMATGTENFKDEQSKLVRMGRRYDPAQYKSLIAKAHRRDYPPAPDSDEFDEYLDDVENQDARETKRIQDTVSCLADHVPTYESAVDILVATPGRLLEHIGVTLGFSLAHLEWLILDEADKLIDQQYHGVLRAITEELERPRPEQEQDAREQYLRSKGCWNEQSERRVRKVMLSATMTRDVSKLVDLKLKRPQLVIVRSQDDVVNGVTDNTAGSNDQRNGVKGEAEDEFELPPTLREYCAHVGDGSEKPLYLAELLRRHILTSSEVQEARGHIVGPNHASDASDVSDKESSTSDSASEDGESDANLPSDREANSEAESEAELDDQADMLPDSVDVDFPMHPERTAMLENRSLSKTSDAVVPTILVFTSSTETTNRLSHLLKNLHPDLETAVYTITAADKTKNPFSRTKPNEPIIAISTDRTARGLDTIAHRPITHVLQYDVPRSAAGYVHRVGRTARAGRFGEAWTLYTHSEARWFLNEVARAKTIKRVQPVEKFKLPAADDESQERLKDAIASMREEVYTSKGSGRKGK